MNENSKITDIQVARPAHGWKYVCWMMDGNFNAFWINKRDEIVNNQVTIVPISAIGRLTASEARIVPIGIGTMMQAIVNHVYCYIDEHGLWDEAPEPAPSRTYWNQLPSGDGGEGLYTTRSAKLMYEAAKYLTNVMLTLEGPEGEEAAKNAPEARAIAEQAIMMVDGRLPFDPDLDAQLLLYSINETARDKIKVFEGILNESSKTNPRKRISFFESEFFGGNLPERIS